MAGGPGRSTGKVSCKSMELKRCSMIVLCTRNAPVGSDVDGDARVKTRDQAEKHSLLQAHA